MWIIHGLSPRRRASVSNEAPWKTHSRWLVACILIHSIARTTKTGMRSECRTVMGSEQKLNACRERQGKTFFLMTVIRKNRIIIAHDSIHGCWRHKYRTRLFVDDYRASVRAIILLDLTWHFVMSYCEMANRQGITRKDQLSCGRKYFISPACRIEYLVYVNGPRSTRMNKTFYWTASGPMSTTSAIATNKI